MNDYIIIHSNSMYWIRLSGSVKELNLGLVTHILTDCSCENKVTVFLVGGSSVSLSDDDAQIVLVLQDILC